MRALFTAATGMEAQQTRVDAIANNISNVGTTAFKKSRAEFHDLFYEILQAPGATSVDGVQLPTGALIGHGVKLASLAKIPTQGDRQSTGRDLDLAIDGDGYFQIQKAGGETVFTRDGSFNRDSEGNVVTSHGYNLLPNVQIPQDAIQVTILPDGTLSALIAGDTEPTDLGQVELARFVNPAGLRAIGGNLFVPSGASGDAETGAPDADGFGALSQGFLESSNVKVAEELIHLILAQRAFEVNTRVIQAADEMLRAAASLQS